MPLTRGDEVWFVQIERGNELLGIPELHHGVVTGGGPYQVVIDWDHWNRPDRASRRWIEERVSLSEADAWSDARRRLQDIADTARSRVDKAESVWKHIRETHPELQVRPKLSGPQPR